eukprot:TRINITY_DN18540_c0_g1_i1.p1 TRINITY_DN18540_c0_g1~~TRINITY_DN18540_c0_g1_i1.p1  ORF type:complete len:295 (+),score=78.14 TRINITY_DN18540_c0_g1_i1:103-987(+)
MVTRSISSYEWTQDGCTISISVPVPPTAVARDIAWRITPRTVTFGIRGVEALLGATLLGSVRPEECFWVLSGEGALRRAVASLEKSVPREWTALTVQEEECAAGVQLNVYDVAPVANAFLGFLGFGLHHTGVEVYGYEFCFGRESGGASGVRCLPPRSAAGHTFRETHPMGRTHLSRQDCFALVRRLAEEWAGVRYHLLRRNCNDFSAVLCRELLGMQTPEFPGWVNRAARGCAIVLPEALTERANAADAEAFKELKMRDEMQYLAASAAQQARQRPRPPRPPTPPAPPKGEAY